MTTEALVVGYGAIADYVAKAVANEPELVVRWVLTREGREERAREIFGRDTTPITSVDALNGTPDVALECAGHGAVREHGAAILRRGVDLGIVSIGALSEDSVYDELEGAARDGGATLSIISGAIGAIDALSAAREGGLESVVYSGVKPPAAWRGSPAEEACDLDALTEAFAFFEGTARDAARRYPKNANVAATVALAGTGLDETRVRLVADPSAAGNTHHVEARGLFGRFEITMSGQALPDNPKSSALTAMSAVRFLKQRIRPVVF